MTKLFKKLKAGFEDIIAHQEGKLNLRSEKIVLPDRPSLYKPREIKKIRERKKYSQGVFANVLNVSIKTVQSWESGSRAPSHAALRLLQIIDQGIYNPEVYRRK